MMDGNRSHSRVLFSKKAIHKIEFNHKTASC